MVVAREKTITSLMTPVESSIEVLHSILHPLGHNMIEYSMYGFSSQSIEVAFLQIQFKLFRFRNHYFSNAIKIIWILSWLISAAVIQPFTSCLFAKTKSRTFDKSSCVNIFCNFRRFYNWWTAKILLCVGFDQYKNVPPFLRSEVFHDQLNQQQK